ncbi:MAG: hypothetical protein LBU07_01375 [Coriobacteriales bacterium]|jgi:alginate O-acetyltransferase complex protein AlgI|nr:hypothetical protein [Coriobacteriales bacterium]
MRAKNALLIVASLLFYSYGEPVFVVLMLFSTLFNYGFGRLLGKTLATSTDLPSDTSAHQSLNNPAHQPSGTSAHRPPGAAKLIVILAIMLNLGMLAVFKYANMFIGSVFDLSGQIAVNAGLLAADPPLLEILLPIGISFYTFQALSYVIDVYRGQVVAQKNYLNILLYISFFPQLIAGPIVKYHDIAAQLQQRSLSAGRAAYGFRRFCVGLAKKVLIANSVAICVDTLFDAPANDISAAAAWLAALAYLLQIYYDFSGYSDMAIGLGKMFGFDFKENFRYPYISTTIKEFWRRWHISLSTWFKEYLYIPLGGNRRGRARTALNKLVVFFCTGLWHGANWTFVVWGLFHGVFLLAEDYLPLKKLPRLLGHIYALLIVCLGFVLFRAADFGQAALFISQMFTGWWLTPAAASLVLSQLNPLFILVFGCGALGSFGLPDMIRRFRRHPAPASGAPAHAPAASGTIPGQATLRAFSYLGSLALLALCLLFLASGGYNPFIYFRF